MPRLNASQSTRIFQWLLKPYVDDDRIPPVQNTWYTVLNVASGGCKPQWIRLFQTNDEAAAKNLDVEITVDGVLMVNSVAAAAKGFYYVYPVYWNQILVSAVGVATPFNLEGHAVRVRYRITSALGTNEEIQCTVDYETWEQV